MSVFVYVLAEGVTDVMLIQRVLRRYFAMEQVKTRTTLPDDAGRWLDRFKWPHGDVISRLAVPAPVFMRREGVLVALRNAQGISRMNETLDVDDVAFELLGWAPDAFGVLLDADDQAPADRFRESRDALTQREQFPDLRGLQSAEEVLACDSRRSGIFVFPSADTQGTLDCLLLALGKEAFQELHDASQEFVTSWHPAHSAGELFKELRKPAGVRKAQLSGMAALLKPGKSLHASLHDQPWVPEGQPPTVLEPLVRFLTTLVGGEGTGPDGVAP